MHPTPLTLIESNRALVARHTERNADMVNLLVQCERCKQWTDPDDMTAWDEHELICLGCDDMLQSIIMDEIYDEMDAMRAMDADNAALELGDTGFADLPF